MTFGLRRCSPSELSPASVHRLARDGIRRGSAVRTGWAANPYRWRVLVDGPIDTVWHRFFKQDRTRPLPVPGIGAQRSTPFTGERLAAGFP